MSNKKAGLNAVKLRWILVAVLTLTFALLGAGAWFALGQLGTYAGEVNNTKVKADESGEEVDRIQQLSQKLDQNRAAYEKAKQVVAESRSYTYQNVIIDDIKSMAARAGVSITSFDFTATGQSGSNSTTGKAEASTQQLSGGLKSTTTVITIAGPVEYANVMNFMNYIEQNLTKMQITNTTFSRDGENKSLLGEQQITVEVYVQ